MRLQAHVTAQTATIQNYAQKEESARQQQRFLQQNTIEFLQTIVSADPKYTRRNRGEWLSTASQEELLEAARKVYNEREKRSNDIKQSLATTAEMGVRENELLREQIAALKKEMAATSARSKDPQSYVLPKNKDKNPQKDRNAAEKGKGGQANRTPSQSARINISEEDDPLLRALDEEGDSVAEAAAAMKPTPLSIPVSRSKRRQEEVAVVDAKAKVTGYGIVEFEHIMEQINDTGWAALSVMAETGLSVYSDILSRVLEKNVTTSKSMVGAQMKTMQNCGVISNKKISTPFRKNFMVCCITSDIGKQIYLKKYPGRKIKEPEARKILSEHTSFEHGYAIIEIADIISKQECVKSVDAFNRKNAIPAANGEYYVPDVKIVDEYDAVSYIEYECGTTSNREFFSKCSKMFSVTKTMLFMGNNRDTTERLCEQVGAWIKSKGVSALRGAVIKIVAANNMSKTDFRDSDGWKYVFTIDGTPESATPVQKF